VKCSTECPYDEGTETGDVVSALVLALWSSTECPYDEGTETAGQAPRALRPRGSTECPYDEGTETGPGVHGARGRSLCSTECPYDEGTETPRDRPGRLGQGDVPPSAPMTRGLKLRNGPELQLYS